GSFLNGYLQSLEWNRMRKFINLVYGFSFLLEIHSQSNFTNFKLSDITSNGGSSFMRNKYESNAAIAITTVFPEKGLQLWKFASVPKTLWNSLENQRWSIMGLLCVVNVFLLLFLM